MNIGPPVIVGIIAGVTVLNLALAIAWCTLKRRRSQAKRRLIATPYDKSSSTITLPSTSLPKTSPPQVTPGQSQTYLQMIMSIQSPHQPTLSYRPRQSFSSASSRTVLSKPPKPVLPKIKTGSMHLPAAKSSNEALTIPASILQRGPSVRSLDTESVYSAASAPLDFHDRMFQPRQLETIPGSPVTPSSWGNHLADPLPSTMPESDYVWPRRRRASLIREELAPETYMKIRWKSQPQEEAGLESSPEPPTSSRPHSDKRTISMLSIPPVPPLPECLRPLLSSPPSVTISPRSHYRSFSEHQSGSLAHSDDVSSSSRRPLVSPSIATSSSFSSLDYVAPSPTWPELPTRSPLRRSQAGDQQPS
jgi:hypothetical protein